LKIAHLADLHLGYRAYNRTAHGINVRERDTAAAFSYAVDRLLEMQPDAIVIAGDIFHTCRPTNTTVAFAQKEFFRLAQLGVPIIVTSGNHDQPRTVETGDPVQLLSGIPNVVYLPHTGATWVWEEGKAEFVAFPYGLADDRYIEDPRNLNRVAVVHGDPPSPEMVKRFDLILMGHYHIMDRPLPNAFYCGSLERVSSNVWIEESPKGFLIHDTTGNPTEFVTVPTRPMHDLPRIFAAQSLTSEELASEILVRVDAVPGGIEGKIVRLVIEDCPAALLRALPHEVLRECRARALHFQLHPIRPTARPRTVAEIEARKKTLREELDEFIRTRYEASSADIDLNYLAQLATSYLDETVTEAPTFLQEEAA
jgi:exonuclease SbcD